MKKLFRLVCMVGCLLLFLGAQAMPGEDLGTWKKFVTTYKDYFSRLLPKGAAKGYDDGIGLSSYDWKRWTENDLEKLATSDNGIDMFSGLMSMKDFATEKNTAGSYTQKAVHAQNALTELKPDCCKNWKSFHNMIVRVQQGNKDAIVALMKRNHISIPEDWR